MNTHMLEFLLHVVPSEDRLGMNYFNPYRHFGSGVKPKLPFMDRPFGPGYQTHPELSRSGVGYIASRFVLPISYVGVPIVLAAANVAVIESAPEEEQRGLWRMFSSALTGTWGGDYSGLV